MFATIAIALTGCSSDSTQHWTSLLMSEEEKGVSYSAYADLDLAPEHEATFAGRGVIDTETAGLVEIESSPGTWHPDGEGIALHLEETVIPQGGFRPEMDLSCARVEASLVCTLGDGTTVTFEEREEADGSLERWTLFEVRNDNGSVEYPYVETLEDEDGTWDRTYSAEIVRDDGQVSFASIEALSGGGAVHSTEDRLYGVWSGSEDHPQLVFEAAGYAFDCERHDQTLTCDSYGTLYVWVLE